jgi:hypothetical protein
MTSRYKVWATKGKSTGHPGGNLECGSAMKDLVFVMGEAHITIEEKM